MLTHLSSPFRFLMQCFSKKNKRLKKCRATLAKINQEESVYQKASDDELRSKAISLQERAANGEPLESLLVPSFALLREVSYRQLGMRHFDVQIIGAIALNDGMIAEMKTGEGKTLVATLPTFLNALKNPGVHIITVNDYLAKRDAHWMGNIFRFFQWDVGCLVSGLSPEEKKKTYQCQVIYGTNNEFCFDHLRDHLQYIPSSICQKTHHFAIVDEVDSILIDEARTPLIISGPSDIPLDNYQKVDHLIASLACETYDLDEKERNVTLTDDGHAIVEKALKKKGMLNAESVYDPANATVMNQIQQALKAHHVFKKDKDYVVRQGKVVIVDDFSGRMMAGRRYGQGLHQAIEAKEKVEVQKESITLCSITFQNYFRLYEKLAGMTGTALTEEKEFQEIYGLSVLEIPTNVPMIRQDKDDVFYQTYQEKCEAICKVAKDCYQRSQPLLVGTTSIEKSEYLSKMFTNVDLPHQVLNARHHEKESDIIASAGMPKALTIATNMAGRGTDIVLGGVPTNSSSQEQEAWKKRNQKVRDAGGLYVLGSERHESRRVDNQLRGRSGRQGDTGVSCFFLSLEDDLPRISGMTGISKALGGIVVAGEPLEHPMLTKAMERAQKQVEARNFQIRKTLLRYDDVIHHQRKIIYQERKDLLFEHIDVWKHFLQMREDILATTLENILLNNLYPEQWDIQTLKKQFFTLCGATPPLDQWIKEENITPSIVENRLEDILQNTTSFLVTMEKRDTVVSSLMLRSLDRCWRHHINSLEQLRQGMGLRGYGQRDPLQEYRLEAFDLFESFLNTYHVDVVSTLSKIRQPPTEITMSIPKNMTMHHPALESFLQHNSMAGANNMASPNDVLRTSLSTSNPTLEQKASSPPSPAVTKKIGRNATCHCGSGKKYKKCCGKNI